MTKDSVCGMQVDETRTTATAVYLGKTYYFCSKACQQMFEKAPEKYAKPGGRGSNPRSACQADLEPPPIAGDLDNQNLGWGNAPGGEFRAGAR